MLGGKFPRAGVGRSWGMLFLAALTAAVMTAYRVPVIEGLPEVRAIVVQGLVTGISVLGIEALLFACVWRGLSLKRRVLR